MNPRNNPNMTINSDSNNDWVNFTFSCVFTTPTSVLTGFYGNVLPQIKPQIIVCDLCDSSQMVSHANHRILVAP